MKSGDVIEDELERANAHPAGAIPFARANYVKKFDMLTENIISKEERDRFIALVENLRNLTIADVAQLNVLAPEDYVVISTKKGIFE